MTDTPADVWTPDDAHLMWLETRQDGQAVRIRCLSCGPLYARDVATEVRNGALGMDRVRHRAYVARAAAEAAAAEVACAHCVDAPPVGHTCPRCGRVST